MADLELYYVVSREDKEAFLVRVFTYAHSVCQMWWRIWLLSFGVAGIAAGYAFYDTHDLLRAVGVFLTISAILLSFYLLFHWDWRRQAAQAYLAQFPQSFPSPHRVVVTDSGFSVSWGKDAITIPFDRSMKIHRADGWTDFVNHSEYSGIGIPDVAFKDEADRAQFVGTIEIRLEAARSKG